MRKIALFVLLLVAVAGAAQAAIEPRWGVPYTCFYSNYSGNATDGGESTWVVTGRFSPGGTLLIRCLESFDTSYGGDTYKCSWAKPSADFFDYTLSSWATNWEFTFNPYGPQCKKAKVSFSGHRIDFNECTDGHSRVCATYW